MLLGLFEGEEEFSEIALDEVGLEEGFFGGTGDEFAAFAVSVEVEGVDVHEAFCGDSEGDAEDF